MVDRRSSLCLKNLALRRVLSPTRMYLRNEEGENLSDLLSDPLIPDFMSYDSSFLVRRFTAALRETEGGTWEREVDGGMWRVL